MVNVNGKNEGGGGVYQSKVLLIYGEAGEDLCPKLFRPFIKTITRGSNSVKSEYVDLLTGEYQRRKDKNVQKPKNRAFTARSDLLMDSCHLWRPVDCPK